MFDIFCHKITFVFQDTQVDVKDLLDLGLDGGAAPTKKELIARLNALLEKRKNDRLSKKTTDAKNKKLRKSGEGSSKTA